MSRSLDKAVLLSLKAEDPEHAYHDISSLFTRIPDDRLLLEIEFLGPSHPLDPGTSFLKDGNAVAIPKLRLFQAFSVARQLLATHLALATKEHTHLDVMAATSVLLLMDPEHLTAANERKRAVMSALDDTSTDLVPFILRQEKQWVDSILTSRLNRHTKSPTLWAHRRWLLQSFSNQGIALGFQQDLASIVMTSAERHPHNYYAWDHARWLFRVFGQQGQVQTLVDCTRQWCFKHHSDTSGWSFLSFLLCNIVDNDVRLATSSSVLQDTLKLAESLRWTNQSVWSFLRAMAASDVANETSLASFFAVNEQLSANCEAGSTQKQVLESARQWCNSHRSRP
jgi:protein prenyltransferase alpha subunit repeat containing protein 1